MAVWGGRSTHPIAASVIAMSRTQAIQRLKGAQTGTRVRLQYRAAFDGGTVKSKTGIKVEDGGPIEAAVIDLQDQYDCGKQKRVRINNGGHLRMQAPKEPKRIGSLASVELPEDHPDDCVKITLEDADEVDWLKRGRESGEEA